jgi:hypothetical protein
MELIKKITYLKVKTRKNLDCECRPFQPDAKSEI